MLNDNCKDRVTKEIQIYYNIQKKYNLFNQVQNQNTTMNC